MALTSVLSRSILRRGFRPSVVPGSLSFPPRQTFHSTPPSKKSSVHFPALTSRPPSAARLRGRPTNFEGIGRNDRCVEEIRSLEDELNFLLLKRESSSGRTTGSGIERIHGLLGSLARVSHPSVGDRCMRYLRRIESHSFLQPNRVTYNICVEAHAKYSAQKSQDLHEDIMMRAAMGSIWPDVIATNRVLKAWCREGNLEKALNFLLRTERYYLEAHVVEESVCSPKPPLDSSSYGILMREIAGGRKNNLGLRDGYVTCMDLLERMRSLSRTKSGGIVCAPTVRHHNYILDALHDAVLSGVYGSNGGTMAQRFVEQMEQAAENVGENHVAVLPNVQSYNTAIATCLACNTDDEGPRRAVELLRSMVHRHTNGHDGGTCRPSRRTCSLLLNGIISHSSWTRPPLNSMDGDAGLTTSKIVEQLLIQMERWYWDGITDAPPDVKHFTSLLVALARAGDVDGAHDVLRKIGAMNRAGNSNTRPDLVTHNAVLDACARVGEGERAEELIDEMKHEWKIQPDAISWRCVVRAYTTGGNLERARKALEVMVTENLMEPDDVATCNFVLRAYARAESEAQAEERVDMVQKMDDFFSLSSQFEPDSATYSIVLSGLTRGGQWNKLRPTFKRCINKGKLNNYILNQLRSYLNKEKFAELLLEAGACNLAVTQRDDQSTTDKLSGPILIQDLPPSWSACANGK